ncbi:hypothetical protein HDU76_002570 [Blyttiomyces sp. JEL0837]|nr:hypothetical protein HDU76_002570 [Blyttiomyces sp. JEL0837]
MAALRSIVRNVGDTFTFMYEGLWEHKITVKAVRDIVFKEDIETEAESHELPKCIDGKYSCPPDEIGGPDGYKAFLKVIQDNSPNEKFPSREAALQYAMDKVGLTNFSLDSYVNKTKDAGWEIDSFRLDAVNKQLAEISDLLDWEDEETHFE